MNEKNQDQQPEAKADGAAMSPSTPETFEIEASFKSENFSLEVMTRVDPNRIAELLCAAFDNSAVADWASMLDTVLPEGFNMAKVAWAKGSWAEVRKCYIAPLVEGGCVRLKVPHEDGGEIGQDGDSGWFTLDSDAIRKGLNVMASKYPRHWSDFVTENEDAITGDVFVQCCIFGDIVYG